MTTPDHATGPRAVPPPARPAGAPRTWLVALGVLSAALLAMVLWLAGAYERSRLQDEAQGQTEAAANALRAHLAQAEQGLQMIALELRAPEASAAFRPQAEAMLAAEPALLRIERRGRDGALRDAVQPVPARVPLGEDRRRWLPFEAALALQAAFGFERLAYARSYWVQLAEDRGIEILEVITPVGGASDEAVVALWSMPRLLDTGLPQGFLAGHRVVATEADGTLIARASASARAAGPFGAAAGVDLPGTGFVLRADSVQAAPGLVPNALTALLVLMVAALFASAALLLRDLRLRARAERELRAQFAFRAAMEDSLVTGLRARDLQGRITYVNAAFCEMTGFGADELVGRGPPMPYWAPEGLEAYERRLAQLRAGAVSRAGYETEFMRRSGERFPVLVFEAPLVDADGRQTGWMSSILDISETRRAEDATRRAQDQLQASARMAMLGEVASALSHELNQPLAAITSYATGCENLLERPGHEAALRGALQRIRAQSERAGQVIRSVSDFVRRRRIERAPLALDALVADLRPLIELQCRKGKVAVALDLAPGAVVRGDRTLLEQVVLNLTRNAVESMADTPDARRRLEVRVGHAGAEVTLAVLDRGVGVPAGIRQQLFLPFVSSKPDGLGLGLSLCRSVAEQLGGRLEHADRDGGGTIFRLSLPAFPDGPATDAGPQDAAAPRASSGDAVPALPVTAGR